MTDDPEDTGERRRMSDMPHPWRMPLDALITDAALALAGAAIGAAVVAVVWWLV